MSKAIITSRALRNTETGIDITVPEFRTFSKLLTTQEEFHVITITRLAYFKTKEHNAEDVVQFMVPKLYADFEALHRAMSERYPATIFPELPKKILIVRDSTPQQRRVAFDRLMQFIAGSSKVCMSPLLLQFLGVSQAKINAIDGAQKNMETGDMAERGTGEEASATESPTKSVKSQSSSLFGEDDSDDELFKTDKDDAEEEEEEADGNLFSPTANQSSVRNGGGKGELIVSADVQTVSRTELQESLFLGPGGATSDVTSSDILGLAEEDNSDLLNVEDDLEKLLTLSAKPKPSPRPKPAATTATKPTLKPRPSPKPTAVVGVTTKPEPTPRAVDQTDGAAALMAEDDIMRYIQENAESGDATLDLF